MHLNMDIKTKLIAL